MDGVEIGLTWTGTVEVPAGCGTVLLEVKAAGVGGGFASFAEGLGVSSGGVEGGSVDAKPSDGRVWSFEMKASSFVDAVVGVGSAGECRAASCIDFAINRFNKSTASKGRGGIACSFRVFPLWKRVSYGWPLSVHKRRVTRPTMYSKLMFSFVYKKKKSWGGPQKINSIRGTHCKISLV